MGPHWGVNRSVAQIHALLYLSPDPFTAEEISGLLSIARSNVSNSLKELQSWHIVQKVAVLGDRREHFKSEIDVWEMFQTVLAERKKREFDPTLKLLREMPTTGHDSAETNYTRERLAEMREFFESTSAWYVEIGRLSPKSMRRLATLGRRVRQLVDPGSR